MLLLLKQKSSDQMWDEVRDHYEKTYHVRFKVKPKDDIIKGLWQKIQILHVEYMNHQEKSKK